MTRTEHLLCIIAEECAEVAQRASKAMRFGLSEVQPGQPHTNLERMKHELTDLMATLQLLGREIDFGHGIDFDGLVEAKIGKVEKFLKYSAECGTLTGA